MKPEPTVIDTIDDILARQTKLAHVSESAQLDCQLLLAHLLQCSRASLYANGQRRLTAQQVARFEGLLERRIQGEPVAYLIGSRDFWRFTLTVQQGVLVPRPETELLVDIALARIRQPSAAVLDAGTGSGAIAIALANERPNWSVHASDVCPIALDVAAANIDQHARGSVTLSQRDWLTGFKNETFDAIISNPPYVAEGDPHLARLTFEPTSALVSGVDGLDAIRTLAHSASSVLIPGGLLLVEHGFNQRDDVADIMRSAGLVHIENFEDLAGQPRATIGYRKETS